MQRQKINLSIIRYILLISLIFSCKREVQTAIIQTEFGTIELEIYVADAPITASNFMKNCNDGIYKNSIFYRVVNDSNQPNNFIKIDVIQGGLYIDSIIDSYPTIIHETTENTGIKHLDGTISMARNEPGSASTEFFICIGDQPELDFGGKRNPDGQGFSAFGRVINGMDVVYKIHKTPNIDQSITNPIKISNIILSD